MGETIFKRMLPNWIQPLKNMVHSDKLILSYAYKFGLWIENLLWNYTVLKNQTKIPFNLLIRSRKYIQYKVQCWLIIKALNKLKVAENFSTLNNGYILQI